MRPSTGTEYSDDFSFELARSSSAAPQRRLSSSVVFAGIVVVGRRMSGVRFSCERTVYRLATGYSGWRNSAYCRRRLRATGGRASQEAPKHITLRLFGCSDTMKGVVL